MDVVAAIAVIGKVALQVLKLCNKCCKDKDDDDKNKGNKQKEKEDDEQEDDDEVSDNNKDEKVSESESEPEEKKESAPMKKKKRGAAKKKRSNACSVADVKPVTTQPVTIQATISPVIYNNFQPHPSADSPNGTDSAAADHNVVEWVYTTIEDAVKLIDKALVGGYDREDNNLWFIRARLRDQVIPGTLNHCKDEAVVPTRIEGQNVVRNVKKFEVLCIAPELRNRVIWTKCGLGDVPKNAVEAGRISHEKLYIGREIQEDEGHPGKGVVCPGMIQPNHGVLYVTYDNKFYFGQKFYEVLCIDHESL